MNTVFTSDLTINQEMVTQYFSTQLILKERINYLQSYGDKILSIKIGQQFYIYTNIDNLQNSLKKTINANELLIQMFKSNEGCILLQEVCQASKNLKIIEIQELNFLSNDLVDLLKNQDQLQSLDLQFAVHSQEMKKQVQDFKYLCDSLPDFKNLQTLKITIQNVDASSFFDSFKKISQLKELQLIFEEQKIVQKRFKQLQDNIVSQNQLKSLMLSFIGCTIPEESAYGFFTAIKKAGFNLLQFGFAASFKADEKLFSLIQQFISSQKELNILEISGFLFKDKLLESFSKLLTTRKTLQNLTVDYYGNNLRNISLSQLATSLSKLKEIRNLKILFDESTFSGESTIEFGEALKSLPELKDLRLEFPGRLREDSVYDFSNLIAKCQQLSYLYIYFSRYGQTNFVEIVSEIAGQTIFNNKKLKIRSTQCSNVTFSSGFYNYYLVQLVIGYHFHNIEYLQIKQIPCHKSDLDFQQKVKNQLQLLIEKCNSLKAIIYSTSSYQCIDEKIYNLIQNNIKTLEIVELYHHIDDKLFKILTNQPNLLVLKFVPLFYLSVNLDLYFKAFPKLLSISTNTVQLEIDFNQALSYFQSDALLENISDTSAKKNDLNALVYEYTIFRKRTQLSINTYIKYIKQHLIYKQDLSHFDLWCDL
ncbi:hypothetical protein TTHERM_00419780 (macronuclear) [Tetrahymena thermophila SB210]|uniref:Kinase domain protein n=1 Tax=Tetrahymena thermophila (strain SB210) TaxID=312017 RepID=I7M6P3_TETTS|nr:hypothetical protein TTHERM_00419780 [Tetrahymena thermophila SB210]EAR85575.2 hypothetical protein TTHERM_00419780 [Tetrahymena thermophila SB210]|eukprot:XP_001033238.2 hypothetical protein TTHERM_00419780 [Tetrahymena thermophila SB210]